MFRASIAPIIRSTKNVTAASGTGHSNDATTFLQRGLIRSLKLYSVEFHENPFSIFVIILAEQETEGQTWRNKQGHNTETFSCECTKDKFDVIFRSAV